MKRSILIRTVVFALIAFSARGVLAQTPNLINHLPSRVFTPIGFDDNDNTQVILDGVFSNTCHKVGPAEVSIVPMEKKIYIRNQAYFYGEGLCLMMLVPYTKVIDVGVLPTGRYTVEMATENDEFVQMGTVEIDRATSPGQDNFLYAPVESARVINQNGVNSLLLEGTFSTNCMAIKTIRVLYQPNDVVVVLPIAEMTNTQCQNKAVKFSETVELRDQLQGRRVLFHIRSLNGQAINLVNTL